MQEVRNLQEFAADSSWLARRELDCLPKYNSPTVRAVSIRMVTIWQREAERTYAAARRRMGIE